MTKKEYDSIFKQTLEEANKQYTEEKINEIIKFYSDENGEIKITKAMYAIHEETMIRMANYLHLLLQKFIDIEE